MISVLRNTSKMTEGGSIGVGIDLPVELWQAILECIDDMATRQALSLTSHHFLGITQPYIFQHILVEPLPEVPTKGINMFIEFLRRTPRIASFIRRLTLQEKDRVFSRLAGLDLDDLERVMASLPNLKDLTICTPIRWSTGPPPTRAPTSIPIVVDNRGVFSLESLTLDVLQHFDRAHACPALLLQGLFSLFREIKHLRLARFDADYCDCSIPYFGRDPPPRHEYFQHIAHIHPVPYPSILMLRVPISADCFVVRFILQDLPPLRSLNIERYSSTFPEFWGEYLRKHGLSLLQCSLQDVVLSEAHFQPSSPHFLTFIVIPLRSIRSTMATHRFVVLYFSRDSSHPRNRSETS